MESFPSFLVVAVLAVAIPGPDTFVVLRTALARGARAGMWAAAGSAAGNVMWGTASVLGVAGLLATSGAAFAVLKLAGAAYLVVLGLLALRASYRGEALAPEDEQDQRGTAAAAFRRGLTSDLLNVKVGLFWTALVPQFVTADSSPLLPAAMVLTMSAMAFGWFSAYAHLAARLSRTLKRRGSARAVNGTVGAVLVALGTRLGAAHP